MSAVVLAAVLSALAPAQDRESVVTVKRKASIWTLAKIPARKIVEEVADGNKKRTVEIDAPPQLIVHWENANAAPPRPNAFQGVIQPRTLYVNLYEPGKEYPYTEQRPDELAAETRQSLAELLRFMLECFVEFDVNIAGGSWEDVGRAVLERLAAAWAEQRPELLKPHLPEKLAIELASPPDYHVRYPALQASGVTLDQLRAFGLQPKLEARKEAAPTVLRQKSGAVSVLMNTSLTLQRWVLSDGWADDGSSLETAFFNLAEKPGLPKAEDVVALFEMAWKTRSAPVFARVKYHPETRTIMLRGRAEEIEAAQRAFASLSGRPAAPPSTPNPFDGITDTLRRIAELLEAEKKDK